MTVDQYSTDSTTASDADLLARWAALDETGDIDVPLTHADYDRLADIAPEGRAFVENCRAGAIAADALPPRDADDTDDGPAVCYACDGTGMGRYDGGVCSACYGRCYIVERWGDDPADLDDDAFDAYMADAYSAAQAVA